MPRPSSSGPGCIARRELEVRDSVTYDGRPSEEFSFDNPLSGESRRDVSEAGLASVNQPASEPAASAMETERERQITLGSDEFSMGGDVSIP